MKKNLSALLAALMLLSVTACAAHEPGLPPSRWGEMQINSMFERAIPCPTPSKRRTPWLGSR